MRQAVGLVALGLVVVVACAGVAGGSSSAVTPSEVEADRSLNVTAAEPGEVVRVTTTVELPEEDNLDYIDDFDPAFGDTEFVSATEDGDEILPNFLDVANDSAVLVFNDIGPSTVEVVFDVTVPDDADLGDTHEFDGLVQFDDEETPVEGDGTLTVGEDDPAEFAVDIESVPGEVVAGEAFDVEYAVENVGDETGTQDVTVAVDGETIATETVELSGGEETVETANYTTEESDVPDVSVEVASANDTATGTVAVLEPAEFVVDIASIPDEVVAGETLTIEYAVENTGEETATQEITTSVDGETVETETVELSGGEETVETTSYGTDEGDVPAVDVAVASANDTATGTVEVLEPAEFVVDIASIPDEVVAGETLTIEYAVENTGEVTATQEVTVAVGGEQIATETVELSGGETVTETATYTTEVGDIPGVDVAVESEDDTAMATVEVLEPAAFVVTLESVPDEVVVGETIDVEYAVENTGEVTGTQEITTSVDGETVETEPVELSGGESTTGTASYGTEESDTPGVAVEVASANDTATATVEVLEPAAFVVDIASVPDEVAAGETLNIEYTVENTGEETASQEVRVTVGGEQIATAIVELAGGETVTETASYGPDGSDVPEIAVEVASANDTAMETVAVLEPATFVVAVESIPGEVVAGETFDIEYAVENTGDVTASQEVRVTVGGEQIATETVELSGGEETVETASYTTEESDVPDVSIEVASANDTATATVEVLRPAAFVVTVESVPVSVVTGETVPVEYAVENTGDVAGSQAVTLTVDGETVAMENVELSGGERWTGTASYRTGGGDLPSVTVEVASEDHAHTETVDVLEPGALAVELVSIPASVRPGETLDIEYAVENTGEGTATQTVTLTADGEQIATETVELSGGEATTGTASYETEEGDVPAVSVEVASDDHAHAETVAVLEPASFAVELASMPGEVVAGETLDIEYTVENTGDVAGSQAVTLTVEGEQIATETVELSGGEAMTGTASHRTEEGDVPDVSVEVASANDTATETVAVLEPASFAVELASVPGEVVAGETLDIEYTVENTGDVTARQEVTVTVGEETVERATVELSGGESTTGTASYGIEEGDIPETAVAVESVNDTATATVGVTEPGAFEVTLDVAATDGQVSAGEAATVVAVVEYTGADRATGEVAFEVDGTVVATVTVTTADSERLEFSYDATGADAPEIPFAVTADEATATGTIAVDADGDGTDDGTGDGDELEDADDDGPGFGVTLAVGAVLSAALLVRVRRR